MNAAQAAFLFAFAGMTVALVGAVSVVIVRARRLDGGEQQSIGALYRLGRRSADRRELNRWAFYAHRITGLSIFGFLIIHVLDVSTYAFSPRLYDQIHPIYATAPMRLFECALLLALLFHSLNGLRVVAIDLWDLGAASAERLLLAVVAATAVLTVGGSIVILRPVIG